MRIYKQHNEDVRTYFKHRPEDLLEINFKAPDAWEKFCALIGISAKPGRFPWENKTEDIPVGGWEDTDS